MNDSIIKEIKKVQYIENRETVKLGHGSKYKFLYFFLLIEILIVLYYVAFGKYAETADGSKS